MGKKLSIYIHKNHENCSQIECSIIQIKHKVDYLLGYKLYLHPFDRVEGRRPETGQSDVSTVYRPSK